MKGLIFAVVLVASVAVFQETEAAGELYVAPSSCKSNIVGCPSFAADSDCNTCCRRAGCDRGDCDFYNCKCTGCPRG